MVLTHYCSVEATDLIQTLDTALRSLSISITNALLVVYHPTLCDTEDGWGGGISADLSRQTFGPMTTRFCAICKFCWRVKPISGRDVLQVRPPGCNRMKCKPVSGGVRKQIENFVPLVPYRARNIFLDAVSDGGHAGRGAGSTQDAQTGHCVLHLRL